MALENQNPNEEPTAKKRGGRKKTVATEENSEKNAEVEVTKTSSEEVEQSLVEGLDALISGITSEIEKIDFSQLLNNAEIQNTQDFQFDDHTPLSELKEKRKQAKEKIEALQIDLAQYIETALTNIAEVKKQAKKLKKQIKKKS